MEGCKWLPAAIAATLAVGFPAWAASPEAHHAPQHAAALPESLRAEHHALHERLAEAIRAGGRTGEAARALEAVMRPHFAEEERLAMPPLSLLVPLARGERPPHAQAIVAMTDELRREWPKMLREHAGIAERLKTLRAAAVAEKKSAVVSFTEALALHAKTEEEILYPAALLVGDRLRDLSESD